MPEAAPVVVREVLAGMPRVALAAALGRRPAAEVGAEERLPVVSAVTAPPASVAAPAPRAHPSPAELQTRRTVTKMLTRALAAFLPNHTRLHGCS